MSQIHVKCKEDPKTSSSSGVIENLVSDLNLEMTSKKYVSPHFSFRDYTHELGINSFLQQNLHSDLSHF